jgi:L-2,4-diaminobutyrate decarboxylase
VHEWTEETEDLASAVVAYAQERLRLRPVPLDGPVEAAELARRAGPTITAQGIGGSRALEVFAELLAPACISIDHPRYFSFIPCAPTPAAMLFDLVVGASSIYAGSWLEGAGAVYAENEALRWLSDLAGLPESAGGVFVQGGTIANVSALVAARHAARSGPGAPSAPPPGSWPEPSRWVVAASSEVHSSVSSAAAAMDIDVLPVETDDRGRLTAEALGRALGEEAGSGSGRRVFAVVATAGTTNLGIVDDLAGVGRVAREAGLWFHVDGAYGGAALAAPSVRPLFDGIELADSLVVDPHKWLFAPFDCAALIYRHPELGKAAHAQHAGYLEPTRTGDDWSPSDYALHLTRRARGLPFWFSLACHGTDAYAAAIERTFEVARYAAASVRERASLELVSEPMLTVVAFRRHGWGPEEYRAWSKQLLESGTAFVVPTTHKGETVVRLAVVNPRSTEEDIDAVLDTLDTPDTTAGSAR